MKAIRLFLLTLAVAMVPALASAQVITYNGGSSTAAAGIIIPVYCGADSLIQDGTLVMVDTTAVSTTNQKRIVVVPFNGVVVNRYKVIGIAAGDIKKPGRSATGHRGAPGNVLIWGYHPNAKFGASAPTAWNLPVKAGPALYGKLGINGDTLSATVGWAIGPGANNAASNPRAQVFFMRSGAPSPLLAN